MKTKMGGRPPGSEIRDSFTAVAKGAIARDFLFIALDVSGRLVVPR